MTVKLNLNNKILNGCFEYWQRGTSFPAIANLDYHTDRWDYAKNGTMVHTVSRSTDVPTNAFGAYSLLVQCTTAQASIGASNYTAIRQRIEGNVLRTFKNKKIVLSFWIKATKVGTYCIGFRNFSRTRCLVKECSVLSSNTWEKKVIRLQHDATGVWVYDSGEGMIIDFTIANAAAFQTSSPDVWLSENKVATTNQVNGCDTIGNIFQLADVCMVEDNEGQTREPEFQLAGRDLFEELQLCQRYYEKSYNVEVTPGTTNSTGAEAGRAPSTGTFLIHTTVHFKQTKRSNPVMGYYSPDTGAIGKVRNATTNTDDPAVTYLSAQNSFCLSNTGGTFGGEDLFLYHWTADAEL